MKRFLTLNSRILLLVLGGIALPVIILAIAVFSALTQFETTRRTEQYLVSVALATSRQIDSLLDQATAVAQVAAIDESIVSLLEQQPRGETQDDVATRLDQLVEFHQILDFIVVVDIEGHVVSSNVTPSGSYAAANPDMRRFWGTSLNHFSDEREWITRSLLQDFNGPSVVKINRTESSFVSKLRESSRLEVDDLYYLRYATSVTNGGEVLGAVCLFVPWRLVQRRIMDRTTADLDNSGYESGYAYMFDSDGRTIIAHHLRENYNTDVIDTHGLEGLYSAVMAGASSHTYEYPVGVSKIAGIARSVSPAGFGWFIGAGINFPDIYRVVTMLGAAFGAAVIGLAVLTSVLTVRVTRRFRLSVEQLIQTAGRVARGEMPGHISIESQDEIGHLAEAFNEMAQSLRRRFQAQSVERPFREIRPNPFMFGNPIRTGEMFYGRRHELNAARQLLTDSKGGLILVVCGERRSGKTSILYQIKNGALGDGFLPVLIDLQSFATVTSDSDFYQSLSSEIAEAIPGTSQLLAEEEATGQPQVFREFLRQVIRQTAPQRLIILFDEYETLDTLIAGNHLSEQVVPFLASFTESEIPIAYVFSGSQGLDENPSAHWRGPFEKSRSMSIGLLSREDTLALIQEPVEGFVEFDVGIPGGILRLTGGHPYYTQVVCQYLVDHLNRVRHNFCDSRDVATVVDEVITNPPPQMLFFWKQLNQDERLVLSLLAEVLRDDAMAASARQVVELSTQYRLDKAVSEPLTERIFQHFVALERLDVRQGDLFRFRIDLFRLRIKRFHSVWQVIREQGKVS